MVTESSLRLTHATGRCRCGVRCETRRPVLNLLLRCRYGTISDIEDIHHLHDDGSLPADDAREGAALDGEEAGTDTAPRGFEGWRRQSALGAVGTGVARGLQAVFAPPANQPVVAAEAPGDPPGRDDRLRVILDPDDPSKSVAIVPDPDRPGPDEGSPG